MGLFSSGVTDPGADAPYMFSVSVGCLPKAGLNVAPCFNTGYAGDPIAPSPDRDG